MADQTVRQELVAFLKTVLDPSIQVYASPPDVMKAPAVTVSPSDPYAVPYTQGGPPSVLWAFDLMLVTSRVKVDESLARLESMAAEIWLNLREHPNSRWLSFGEIATTDIGDVPMLTGTVQLGIVATITP